jgi:hypothetical protein
LKHVVLAGDPALGTSTLLAGTMGDIRVSVKHHCPFTIHVEAPLHTGAYPQ